MFNIDMTKTRLLILFLSILISSTHSIIPLCSTQQIENVLTKCGLLEKDLDSFRDFAANFFDAKQTVKNMKDVCEKIENCYGTMHCQESIDRSRAIQEKCEMDRFLYGGVPKCIKLFYGEAYEGKNFTCVKEYDFLSYNLTAKRDAFTAGESCVLEVLNKPQNSTCDFESVAFIRSNYQKIIDFITIDKNKKNGSCEEPHDIYEQFQCQVLLDLWFEKRTDLKFAKKNMRSQKMEEFSMATDKFLECMSHSCRHSERVRKEIEFQRKLYMLSNDDNDNNYECLDRAKNLFVLNSRIRFCRQRYRDCDEKWYEELCEEDTAKEAEELLEVDFENTTVIV